ncbi:MAG: hypothetical protein IH944_10995 [Armatimonadetes bacterium]|nr:hypothetical protein [Armatimonadota bacterium]
MADYLNLPEAELIPLFQNWSARLVVHESILAPVTTNWSDTLAATAQG